MTAVEFYDRTPIENVVSSLTTAPDKIIFIGDGKVMRAFDTTCQAFWKKRGLCMEIEYRSINKNSVRSIVSVLSNIVETEEQCVFDLTGGEDLALVAMGIVFEKYADKNIQMQRFNVKNGVVTDCDNDGVVRYSGSPVISVEENIGLHGGTIRYAQGDAAGTFSWEMSDEFVADIDAMWSICRTDPGLWNARLNVLAALEAMATAESPLDVSVDVSAVEEHLSRIGIKPVSISGLLRTLAHKGLIASYTDNGEHFSFSYKNEQVKKCLTKAGTVLELKVTTLAARLTDKEGAPFYTDAMNGVHIDWDGELHGLFDSEKDTENEIDVVLMKGITPVFISCKNGHVDDDELYKLDAVTRRFGGPYAKKVLLATYLGKKATSLEYFVQRAEDMGIHLIQGVHLLSDEQLEKQLKHIVNK